MDASLITMIALLVLIGVMGWFLYLEIRRLERLRERLMDPTN